MNKTEEKPSKFAITPPSAPKAPINPAALERFAAGASDSDAAETKQIAQAVVPTPVPVPTIANAERTKGFLLRLLPEQFDRVEQVYAQSTFKSKQTMGEKLFMDAIEELAKKLGV